MLCWANIFLQALFPMWVSEINWAPSQHATQHAHGPMWSQHCDTAPPHRVAPHIRNFLLCPKFGRNAAQPLVKKQNERLNINCVASFSEYAVMIWILPDISDWICLTAPLPSNAFPYLFPYQLFPKGENELAETETPPPAGLSSNSH